MFKNECSISINITDWVLDQAYDGIFPLGARDKRAIFCPNPAPYPFLNPGKRYLFKESSPRYPEQFWAEIVAYRLSTIFNIEVPPAYPAYDSLDTSGALIEWFYDENDPEFVVFWHGSEFFLQLYKDFDLKRGKQHNIEDMFLIFYTINKILSSNFVWFEKIFQMLLFDSIIGNTDRHQDNWGMIIKNICGEHDYFISPAFDNGTSLGHEILNNNMHKFNAKRIQDYISKGAHHLRVSRGSLQRILHCDTLKTLKSLSNGIGKKFDNSLDVSKFLLDNNFALPSEFFDDLCKIDSPVPLSRSRANFMGELIILRQKMLLKEVII